MCHSASSHSIRLQGLKNLDTLRGPVHSNRRKLKHHHDKQDGKCIWCGEQTYLWWTLTEEEYKKLKNRIATREHMKASSKGGTNHKNNIRCACLECNALRGDIDANAFKYITQDPQRYKKFKELKAIKLAEIQQAKRERDEIRNYAAALKIAVMYEMIRRYLPCQEQETNYQMMAEKFGFVLKAKNFCATENIPTTSFKYVHPLCV